MAAHLYTAGPYTSTIADQKCTEKACLTALFVASRPLAKRTVFSNLTAYGSGMDILIAFLMGCTVLLQNMF